jgi:hypothetical protein
MDIAIVVLLGIIILMLLYITVRLGRIREDLQNQRTILLRTMGILDPEWAKRWKENRWEENWKKTGGRARSSFSSSSG